MFLQQRGAPLAQLQVQPEALAVLAAQHVQRRQHRALVDMHQLERHRQLAVRQRVASGVQALAQGLGIQLQQWRRIGLQVADDQGVAVARVPGQRQHHRQVMAVGGEASGDMHQRLQQAYPLHDLMLAAQLVQVVVEARLTLAQQAGQANGRRDVGQRVVGLAVVDAVGLGEQFQAQADAAVLLRPDDAFRAQRIGGAHQVDQIPAAVAALPFAGIGVEEVAVQPVAGEFVVEAQRVVAGAAGARARQLCMQAGDEVGLVQTLLAQGARVDAGDQAGGRVGQDIVGRAAVQVDGVADDIQRFIRAQAGDLQRAIATRIGPGGFVVVPEDARGHGGLLLPRPRV